jgi:cytochrome P450
MTQQPGQGAGGAAALAPETERAGAPDAERADGPDTAATWPVREELLRMADPAVVRDPYPGLAALREASPFAEFDGALVVAGRYEDCSAVLRDSRASSERNRSLLAPPQEERARAFLSLDPPDHTRLRKLVSKAFTPRMIAQLEPRIREVTTGLLDAAAERGGGEIELVGELAYPLPVRIISEMLGVPPADHATFSSWSARLVHALEPRFLVSPQSAEVYQQAMDASLEFAAYFHDLIAERRARPAPDLLSDLIAAEDAGDRLTEDELIATCVLLLVAGHETTVGLISNAVVALLRHPDQLAGLRADPGLAAGAVEETLRYDAPVQLTGRVVRGGMRVRELEPPDGGIILLLLAATGRDPAVFDDPDKFDIRRQISGHLAFAAGPHFCLGAALARLEAKIALHAFAARLADPELDESRLQYKPNFNLRGPEHLVVGYSAIGAAP